MSNVDITSSAKQIDINIKNNPKDINSELQMKSDSMLKMDNILNTTLKDKVTVTTKSEQDASENTEKQKKKNDEKLTDPSHIDMTRFSLKLETDRELNLIIVKIVDKKTGEIVTQIPPEQTIKTLKYFEKNPGQIVSAQA